MKRKDCSMLVKPDGTVVWYISTREGWMLRPDGARLRWTDKYAVRMKLISSEKEWEEWTPW